MPNLTMEELAVRENWRQIPVLDLTDAEVAQMSDQESRWCHDLLYRRHLAKMQPATPESEPIPETPPASDRR